MTRLKNWADWWEKKANTTIFSFCWLMVYPGLTCFLQLLFWETPFQKAFAGIFLLTVLSAESYMGDLLFLKYGKYVWVGAFLAIWPLLLSQEGLRTIAPLGFGSFLGLAGATIIIKAHDVLSRWRDRLLARWFPDGPR